MFSCYFRTPTAPTAAPAPVFGVPARCGGLGAGGGQLGAELRVFQREGGDVGGGALGGGRGGFSGGVGGRVWFQYIHRLYTSLLVKVSQLLALRPVAPSPLPAQ